MICLTYLLLLSVIYVHAQDVHFLEPGQAFNCCPKSFFRSDPIIYCYKGREKNIVHLWETVQLHINLPSDEFEQFDGTSPADVQSKFENRKSSWYLNIYVTKKKSIKLDPFNTTCIGIVTKNDYGVRLTRIRVDYWKVLMLTSGIALFLLAPKLSSNSVFYYICGVSFGTCASVLILVFIISRLLPKKPMMYSFLVGGWTIGLYLVQFLWDNIRTIGMEYQDYVLYYIISTSIISFMICYRLGPVSDPRSINLIKWLMQGAALVLILFSSDFKEATLAFNILLLTGYLIPFHYFFSFLRKWLKWFGPKPTRRLLSEDEYYQEGVRETSKALEDLRGYCSSPECNQWRTMLKLHDPLSKTQQNELRTLCKKYVEFVSTNGRESESKLKKNNQRRLRTKKKPRFEIRFAKFVEGGSHLEDNEVLAFETDVKQFDDDLLTDDSSSSDSS